MGVILLNWKQVLITWHVTNVKWNQSWLSQKQVGSCCGQGCDVVGNLRACTPSPDQNFSVLVSLPARNFCYCTPKTPRSEFILCFLTLSCQVRSEIQSLPWACQDLAETGPGKVGSPLKGEPSWRCLPPDSVMAGVERRGREKIGPRNWTST